MSKPKQKIDGGGLRYDDGKIRYDLIPVDALEAIAKVFTKGAKKYTARNFERGMAWSKAHGPLLRHLMAWAKGERNDSESGELHMAHVAVNAIFLLAYELRGMIHLDDIEPFLRASKTKKKEVA